MTTDAQVHLWAKETPERPWLPGGRSFAHADEYRVETLIPEMDAAGVQRAVLVPPAYEGDRNDVCLAAAARHPDRFAVMGRLAVADPKSRGLVAGWRDQPGMLGMRLSFARGAAGRYLSDGTADWLWPEAEMAGLPLMIFAPGQLDRIMDRGVREWFGWRVELDVATAASGEPISKPA